MRKKYILLNETPELRKGAVMVEECDEGDQGFRCDDKEMIKPKDSNSIYYTRDVVLGQTGWFEEAEELLLTKKQIKKLKDILDNSNNPTNNQKVNNRVCVICGNTVTGHSKKKYCSKPCLRKAMNNRAKLHYHKNHEK